MAAAKKKSRITPTDIHVGQRVRMRRMMLGISQEKLADKLGITFQQVQKYEKGTNRIGAGRLQQVAEFLEAPIAFFYEGQPDKTSISMAADPISEFAVRLHGLDLAKAFLALKDNDSRKLAVRMVEILRDAACYQQDVIAGASHKRPGICAPAQIP